MSHDYTESILRSIVHCNLRLQYVSFDDGGYVSVNMYRLMMAVM